MAEEANTRIKACAAALRAWSAAYRAYAESGREEASELRPRVDALTPAAQEALDYAGYEVGTVSIDGEVDRTLGGGVRWLHDRGRWPVEHQWQALVDVAERASQSLDDEAELADT